MAEDAADSGAPWWQGRGSGPSESGPSVLMQGYMGVHVQTCLQT